MGIRINPDRVKSNLVTELTAVFEAQPEEVQADFAPIRAAVKDELMARRVHIARLIIERAVVPSELAEVKALLLGKFAPPPEHTAP